GLPTEDEVRAVLQRLDVPHAVLPAAPLGPWLASILLSESLDDGDASADVRRELVRAFEAGAPAAAEAYYRKVYACAKAFDATEALSAECSVLSAESEIHSALSTEHSALLCLAGAAARALAAREFLYRTEPATLRAVIDQLHDGLNAQEQRFVILRSYADALQDSAFWRLMAPLRRLRELLRPRGFSARHLLPWRCLEPVPDAPPGTWKALDDDPQFLASCSLPAGWLRVRLKTYTPDRGHIEFYAERDGGFRPEGLLGQFSLAAGDTEEEFFLRLERPTRA